MKGIDQKLADRVDRVFHAPMQAARRSTEPAHYFQHGPLLVYAVTHLAGLAGVTRSARAYRFGGLHALRAAPRGRATDACPSQLQDRAASLRLRVSGLMPVPT